MLNVELVDCGKWVQKRFTDLLDGRELPIWFYARNTLELSPTSRPIHDRPGGYACESAVMPSRELLERVFNQGI
jgi:hypothetical protein